MTTKNNNIETLNMLASKNKLKIRILNNVTLAKILYNTNLISH